MSGSQGQQAYSPLVNGIAGQLSGMAGLTLIHPVDTIKSRLQARAAGQPKTAVDTAVRMVRQEGMLSLYRGIGAPLVAFGAVNAIAWTANARILQLMHPGDQDWKPSPLQGLLAGTLAGCCSATARGPMERIKTVMQVDRGGRLYRNTWHATVELARKHGIARGWFLGTGATIIREAPQFGFYFVTYDWASKHLQSRLGKDSTVATLMAGAAAGAASWVPTYPLDVVKGRIQAAAPGTYKGWTDCLLRSVEAEGTQVLFRGFSLALLRALPLHATIFLTAEKVKEVLYKLQDPEGIVLHVPNQAQDAAAAVPSSPMSHGKLHQMSTPIQSPLEE